MGNKKKDKKQSYLGTEKCVFCGSAEDNEDVFGQKIIKEDLFIHYFCMLFASGLCQRGNSDEVGIFGFLTSDVIKEVKRASRLRCFFCFELGAPTGCIHKSCRKSYHFSCGQNNGVLFQFCDTFQSFCGNHRPQQSMKKWMNSPATKSPKTVSCSVCMCPVKTQISNDVLKGPCCRNSWFHRDCVQRHATSSGLYYFKCPLCNNKEQFQAEMLHFGIHIPDQDAAWEKEQNAFADLLERHCRCDVEKCLCPKGRSYNKDDSNWEIILCQSCGSQGCHFGCVSLRRSEDYFCPECKSIVASTPAKAKSSPSKKKKELAPTSKENPRKMKVEKSYPSYSPKKLKKPKAVLQVRIERLKLDDAMLLELQSATARQSHCKSSSKGGPSKLHSTSAKKTTYKTKSRRCHFQKRKPPCSIKKKKIYKPVLSDREKNKPQSNHLDSELSTIDIVGIDASPGEEGFKCTCDVQSAVSVHADFSLKSSGLELMPIKQIDEKQTLYGSIVNTTIESPGRLLRSNSTPSKGNDSFQASPLWLPGDYHCSPVTKIQSNHVPNEMMSGESGRLFGFSPRNGVVVNSQFAQEIVSSERLALQLFDSGNNESPRKQFRSNFPSSFSEHEDSEFDEFNLLDWKLELSISPVRVLRSNSTPRKDVTSDDTNNVGSSFGEHSPSARRLSFGNSVIKSKSKESPINSACTDLNSNSQSPRHFPERVMTRDEAEFIEERNVSPDQEIEFKSSYPQVFHPSSIGNNIPVKTTVPSPAANNNIQGKPTKAGGRKSRSNSANQIGQKSILDYIAHKYNAADSASSQGVPVEVDYETFLRNTENGNGQESERTLRSTKVPDSPGKNVTTKISPHFQCSTKSRSPWEKLSLSGKKPVSVVKPLQSISSVGSALHQYMTYYDSIGPVNHSGTCLRMDGIQMDSLGPYEMSDYSNQKIPFGNNLSDVKHSASCINPTSLTTSTSTSCSGTLSDWGVVPGADYSSPQQKLLYNGNFYATQSTYLNDTCFSGCHSENNTPSGKEVGNPHKRKCSSVDNSPSKKIKLSPSRFCNVAKHNMYESLESYSTNDTAWDGTAMWPRKDVTYEKQRTINEQERVNRSIRKENDSSNPEENEKHDKRWNNLSKFFGNSPRRLNRSRQHTTRCSISDEDVMEIVNLGSESQSCNVTFMKLGR